jgi:hypothetical protein
MKQFNTNTKELRNAERSRLFSQHLEKGAAQETFKSLEIFTWAENEFFMLYVYKGNSAKHFNQYQRYRSAERRAADIDKMKENVLYWEKWKAEQKEKNNGKFSTHAAAAAACRAELKKAFPSVIFSVTSDSFSGGDAIRINWTDGASVEQVEAISAKYQYGNFNGMEDIYEYTNKVEGLPQVKYVTESRTMSDEVREQIKTKILSEYGEGLEEYRLSQLIHQDFYRTSFCEIVETKKTEVAEVAEVKAVELGANEVKIVDYSERAIAVIGNTKPIKEGLKELGGKFNFRLSCGAGWIFSKTKLEAVKEFLSKPKAASVETVTFAELEKTPLRIEAETAIKSFVKQDIEIYGSVQESTKEAARVQNVEVKKFDNLADLERAAKGGKMVSLLNMFELINKPKAQA